MLKGQSQKKSIVYLLSGLLVVLVFTTGYFYKQSKCYQKHNRELIIQNDSIIGVNINLTDELETRQSNSKEGSIANIKTGRSK
ncbi:MAG: hypothetical protein QM737_13555 [Ferruginibacter sp.]